MQVIKNVYNDIPEQINIPKEFIHRKGEIIIIIEDELKEKSNIGLKEFFGIIPDLPERGDQGIFNERENL